MTKYNIKGMGCAACVARIEKAVDALTDVESVSVNLLTEIMEVEGSASPEAIIEAVTGAGYGATLIEEVTEETLEDKSSGRILKRFLISIALLIPLMYLSMAVPMLGAPVPALLNMTIYMWLLVAALSLIIMLINIKFFVSGLLSVFHKSPNMDLLVSLGSSASFVYSAVWLIKAYLYIPDGEILTSYYTDNFFFDSAAMILVLVTIGKLLESKSKAKTTSAIKKLMKLTPKEAILFESGSERVVKIEEIRKGDIFVVRPGDRIPLDGIVIDGVSAADESMVTGESLPVDKNLSSQVYGGTININGYLRCKATSTHKDSTIAEIIKLTSSALKDKAPIARIADKVAAVFVPVVLVIALITFAIWMFVGQPMSIALTRAVSVLVISCPCALGLATPVAIMVASGVGAENGILFKGGEAIERLGKVKTALIDKTGTITIGNPSVTNILPMPQVTSEELLEIAYAVESRSEHPLAKAITKAAIEIFGENKTGNLYSQVSNFSTYKNAGVKAQFNNWSIVAGNASLIKDETGVDVSLDIDGHDEIEDLASEGKTIIYFARDKKLIGIIAIADTVKEDSKSAIELLDKMHIDTVMLTGDNKLAAISIAKTVGINKVIAGVKPDGKVAAVSRMIDERSASKDGGYVAMIGDGINDAPALAKADVGVAIAAGSDIASASADVILMKNSLKDFAAGIRLSKNTISNIKENLFFAFCYNIIGIPLAAGVFIPIFGWSLTPMFGAAAMSVSSILVVLNALRLNLKKIY